MFSGYRSVPQGLFNLLGPKKETRTITRLLTEDGGAKADRRTPIKTILFLGGPMVENDGRNKQVIDPNFGIGVPINRKR